MKLFYTRKEVDEEISRAMIQREKDKYIEQRFDSLVRDMSELRERIQRLEMANLEHKYFTGSGGTGTVQPEFCNCKEERK